MGTKVFRFFLCSFQFLVYLAAVSAATTATFDLLDNNSDEFDAVVRNYREGGPVSGFGTENEFWGQRQRPKNQIVTELRGDDSKSNVMVLDGKCSRYCLLKNGISNREKYQYASFLWTVSDISLTDDLISPMIINTSDIDFLNNCAVYIDVDCNTKEATSISNNSNKELEFINENSQESKNNKNKSLNYQKLLEIYDLQKSNEKKFFVNDSISNIIINLEGDLSSAFLQIPLGSVIWQTGIAISFRSKRETEGVDIHVRNAPSGEWLLKLQGMKSSKYNVILETTGEEFNSVGNAEVIDLLEEFNAENVQNAELPNFSKNIQNGNSETVKTSNIFQELPKREMDAENIWDGSEMKLRNNRKVHFEKLIQGSPFGNAKIVQHPVEAADSLVEPLVVIARENNSSTIKEASNDKKNDPYQDIQGRSSIASVEDFGTRYNKTLAIVNNDVSAKMVEISEDHELSDERLAKYSDLEDVEKQKMLIEINRNSNLFVTPGTTHRVVFDVMNGCVLPVRYAFQAKSSLFRIFNIQPVFAWIYPGQTTQVAVDLVIPNTVGQDSSNVLSLSIVGTEIKEKSVYLYVQGSSSPVTDNTIPNIEYYFNNNCGAKLGKNECHKSKWSAEITIQDWDSGLKRVVASPYNIYPRTNFISGTKDPVTFYYTSSCCDTTARITALDLMNNYNSRTIDVTVWNNLSEAEIAAITIGVLLIILIIILIILIILYCFRRKKSHDLPYTQRYGSRAAPQPERTSF